MAETLKMVPPAAGEDSIHDYPPEHIYVQWAAPASIAFHLLLIGVVALAAYINHVRSLRELMTASLPPPPMDQLQILLIDDNKPPPPTDHPEWIKQLIIPKVKPPPPPPPPKPKPKPKPEIRFVPKPTIGSNSLPTPSYPIEALRDRIQGTVQLQVSFDGSGAVISAEVVSSSGSPILDSGARHFVLETWHSVEMAGQVQTWPIEYVLPK